MTYAQAIKRLSELDPEFNSRHEILREITISAFKRGFDEGYEAGFQVGTAAERGINQMQRKFDEVDELGEAIIQTYEILKPKKS